MCTNPPYYLHSISLLQRVILHFQVCVNTYNRILIVGADNVRSRQMQQIRIALRGKAGRFYCGYIYIYIYLYIYIYIYITRQFKFKNTSYFIHASVNVLLNNINIIHTYNRTSHGEKHHVPQSHSWSNGDVSSTRSVSIFPSPLYCLFQHPFRIFPSSSIHVLLYIVLTF